MRRPTAISILALVLYSSPMLPQQQQPAATGVIEGTVVRSDNGEPISGAQVQLTVVIITPLTAPQTTPPRQFQPVATVADGKFSFKNLDAGSYRIAATMNGFVRAEYGQRSLNGQGRPVFLNAGQTIKDANLRLTPGGTLSGRVFDENGQPATGAPVQLLRVTYNPQGKNYQSMGATAADDRGDFRLYGVTPGKYYLVAGNPPGPNRPIAGAAPAGGLFGGPRYSLVFYPNATEMEQATLVEVKAGSEAAFDMRVQRQQSYRVRGSIVDATGTGLPTNTNVTVGYRSFTGSGGFSNGRNFDPATGNFELQNIPPGDYTLQVQLPEQNPTPLLGPIDAATLASRQAAQAMRPSGQTPIKVVDKDLEGIVITVKQGVTVSGQIILEGQPVTAVPNLQQGTLMFSPWLNGATNGPNPAGTPPAEDGTFQVVGLREGEYRVNLRMTGQQSGIYVKSIRYGGDEIYGKPFKFSGSGSGKFDVILRTGTGQIAGSVSDIRSQMVAGILVVAISVNRDQMFEYKAATTDQNGRFTMTGVIPGDYQLFSWESIDGNGFFDPDFLKQHESQAKLVHVAESSNQNVDVRMIPAQ